MPRANSSCGSGQSRKAKGRSNVLNWRNPVVESPRDPAATRGSNVANLITYSEEVATSTALDVKYTARPSQRGYHGAENPAADAVVRMAEYDMLTEDPSQCDHADGCDFSTTGSHIPVDSTLNLESTPATVPLNSHDLQR